MNRDLLTSGTGGVHRFNIEHRGLPPHPEWPLQRAFNLEHGLCFPCDGVRKSRGCATSFLLIGGLEHGGLVVLRGGFPFNKQKSRDPLKSKSSSHSIQTTNEGVPDHWGIPSRMFDKYAEVASLPSGARPYPGNNVIEKGWFISSFSLHFNPGNQTIGDRSFCVGFSPPFNSEATLSCFARLVWCCLLRVEHRTSPPSPPAPAPARPPAPAPRTPPPCPQFPQTALGGDPGLPGVPGARLAPGGGGFDGQGQAPAMRWMAAKSICSLAVWGPFSINPKRPKGESTTWCYTPFVPQPFVGVPFFIHQTKSRKNTSTTRAHKKQNKKHQPPPKN